MSFMPFGGSSTIPSINGLSDALVREWHVVGHCEQPLTSRTTIATGGTYNSGRIRHVNLTGKTITELRLVYSNTYYSSLVETPTGNAITVKAGIEHTVTTTDTQTGAIDRVYWNGSTSVNISSGGLSVSDPIAVNIAPNDVWYERVAVTVTNNGEYFPRGGSAAGGTNFAGQANGEAWTTSVDYAHSGTFTAQTGAPIFSASAVLGKLADGTASKSIAIIGDSIVGGTDDAGYGANKGGWALRAFASYPCIYVPLGSDTVASFSSRANGYNRWRLAAMASTVLIAYGRNELATATATTQASFLAVAKWFMSRGARVVLATILPAPTTTDGYFTVANQTPQAGASETNRGTLNTWIRDTSASGFVAQANAQVAGLANAGTAAFADPCAGIECNSAGVITANGGYVLASQSAVVVSGTASSGSSTDLTDNTKTPTKNQYTGYALRITGGTGSGQMASILYNSTVGLFKTAQTLSPAPDATSTYEIYDAVGFNGVHPLTRGHALASAAVDAASLMR